MPNPFKDLPEEAVVPILFRLTLQDLAAICKSDPHMRDIVRRNPQLWLNAANHLDDEAFHDLYLPQNPQIRGAKETKSLLSWARQMPQYVGKRFYGTGHIVQPLTAPMTGHTGPVARMVKVGDHHLASCAQDQSIKLWNLETGTCEATFEGQSVIPCLAVLPNRRLASSAANRSIQIWNLDTKQCEATLVRDYFTVTSLVALKDDRLASSSTDGTVKIWNLVTNQCEATLEGHTNRVLYLVTLPDGRLASSSTDCTIKIWNLETRRCEATLQGHTGAVFSLVVLKDGRLASGSYDMTIKIWNLETMQCEATLEGHTGMVTCLVASPDGRLASLSPVRSIRVWDLKTGQCILQEPCEAGTNSLFYDAGALYAGLFNGNIQRFDFACLSLGEIAGADKTSVLGKRPYPF